MSHQNNTTHFENLDGLRFLAFFVVFISHASLFPGHEGGHFYELVKARLLTHGDLGVNFFFVLSGFLITWLLLKEKESSGSIHIRNFYVRRILRIWPLYYAALFLGAVITGMTSSPIYHFPHEVNSGMVGSFAVFAANFEMLYHGMHNAVLSVLWSVSVEEQFYLLWPLVILLVPSRHLFAVLILLLAAATAFRFVNAGHPDMIRHHSISSMADLSTGALLAWLCLNRKDFVKRLAALSGKEIMMAYAIGLLLIPLKGMSVRLPDMYRAAGVALEPLLFSFFFAFVIAEQNFATRSFFKAGKSTLLTTMGRFSYGLYCFHLLVLFLIQLLFMQFFPGAGGWIYLLQVLLALALTILISHLSYRYVESWFLKKRVRYAPSRTASDPVRMAS